MTKSLRYHVLATCQTLLQGKSGYGKVHNFQHFPVVKILIQPYNYQICAGLHVFKFAVFSNFIEIPSSDHAKDHAKDWAADYAAYYVAYYGAYFWLCFIQK